MADKFLLVPGTGGVDFKYVADGQPSGYAWALLKGDVLGDDAMTAEMSCLHPDVGVAPWAPSRTSLGPKGDIAPNTVLDGTAYGAVPVHYQRFPYDWRLDVRYNAGLLLDYLKKNIDWQEGNRWRIVTHSQGGLALLSASRLCQSRDEFSRYVSRVALVACPLIGTLNSIAAVVGRLDLRGGRELVPQARLAHVAGHDRDVPPVRLCRRHAGHARHLEGSLAGGAGAVPEPREPRQRLRAVVRPGSFPEFGRADPAASRIWPRRAAEHAHRGALRPDDGTLTWRAARTGDTLVPYDETIKYVHDQGLVGYSDVVTGTTLADHSNLLNDARVWSVCAGFLEE